MAMDNRSNIIVCALRLFASQGYDSVGVQKIVDTAGVTKPTLYYYFKSKHGLLKALLEEHFEQLTRLISPLADYHGDLSLTLNTLVAAYFNFAKEHGEFYRLQLSLYFMPPEHKAHKLTVRLLDKQHRLVENMFIQASEDYPRFKGHHDYCAASFMGMVDNWISLALNGYAELDSTLVHQTVQQFLYGFCSSEAKPFS